MAGCYRFIKELICPLYKNPAGSSQRRGK